LLAFAQQASGDGTAARASWQAAQSRLQDRLKGERDEPALIAGLGLARAALGDGTQAMALADRAMQREPATLDATVGPAWQEQHARIEVRAERTGARSPICAGCCKHRMPARGMARRLRPRCCGWIRPGIRCAAIRVSRHFSAPGTESVGWIG